MSQRKPLSPVDAAWLRMDSPTNPMVINAVAMFDEPVTVDQWKRILEERFLKFPRFRMRVRNIEASPYWEEDPHFDLDLHIHRVALPAPGSQKELQELVSDLMSHPLDFARPPWEMYMVENYNGGSALIARIHHCIGDGIALVRVLLSMADEYYDPCEIPEATSSTSLTDLLPDFLRGPARLLSQTVKLSEKLIDESIQLLAQPEEALSLARQGVDVSKAVGKLILLPPDSRTLFKGRVGPKKVAAWGQPVPLRTVKAIGKAQGAKINDVAIALVTGALRAYLISRGESPENVNVRVVIPVNLRPLEQAVELGNKFGLVFLSLPLGIEDRAERLQEVKRRMDAIKHSAEPMLSLGILHVIGLAPRKEIQDLVVKLFSQKATAVMSNVPGPQECLHFAGSPLGSIMFWVPQSGDVGMGLSILSYNGEILFGVMTDARLVPDPERIASGFMDEFEAYRRQFAPRYPRRTRRSQKTAK